MNDQMYLQRIQDNPDDKSARTEYLAWLEQAGDDRADYLRLLIERQHIKDSLIAIDRELSAYPRRIDNVWLDTVSPLLIRSQTFGKWYPKPRPQSQPYISVGDFVFHQTVVGLIEVMHTFNEVQADVTGTIAEMCVAEGETVQFNQILFKVNRFTPMITGG